MVPTLENKIPSSFSVGGGDSVSIQTMELIRPLESGPPLAAAN